MAKAPKKKFEYTIRQLSELLESADTSTTNTSMRLPVALRDAAELAVRQFGAAESATALTVAALRASLESIAMQAALDEHYRDHPASRPSLADLAIAAAQLDGHPLAENPRALRRAAQQIIRHHPRADADDVLLWAEAYEARSA
jgi:hypothetical protein